MMTATDVHEVVSRLEAAGIPFWLDGGWGIDALVGRETRPHDDLDLVVSRDTLGDARLALAPLGFEHAPETAPGGFRRASSYAIRVDARSTST